ncbi:MAG: hypothetical protein WDM87_08460 [Terracidiphilus sp.]
MSSGTLRNGEVRLDNAAAGIRADSRATNLRAAACAALLAISLGASGCKHRENSRVTPPQALPPGIEAVPAAPAASASGPVPARIPVTPLPAGGISDDDLAFVAAHRPILSEVGYATWYTAPYKGTPRRQWTGVR